MTMDSAAMAMPNLERLAGRPCVIDGWHGGGAERTTRIRCMRNGSWVDVWERSETYDRAAQAVIRSIFVLAGDSLRHVRTDTVPPFWN
jgi:hypothetical protein